MFVWFLQKYIVIQHCTHASKSGLLLRPLFYLALFSPTNWSDGDLNITLNVVRLP